MPPVCTSQPLHGCYRCRTGHTLCQVNVSPAGCGSPTNLPCQVEYVARFIQLPSMTVPHAPASPGCRVPQVLTVELSESQRQGIIRPGRELVRRVEWHGTDTRLRHRPPAQRWSPRSTV